MSHCSSRALELTRLLYTLSLLISSGIGFGICQRLLSQLSYAHPPDSDPQFRAALAPDVFSGREHELEVAPAEGVTLVLACRSLKRAEGARTKLYGLLDLELEKRRKLHGQDAHAIKFRRNVKIELLELDLAQVGSVFKAADELRRSWVVLPTIHPPSHPSVSSLKIDTHPPSHLRHTATPTYPTSSATPASPPSPGSITSVPPGRCSSRASSSARACPASRSRTSANAAPTASGGCGSAMCSRILRW
jgi:hypothetical protein